MAGEGFSRFGVRLASAVVFAALVIGAVVVPLPAVPALVFAAFSGLAGAELARLASGTTGARSAAVAAAGGAAAALTPLWVAREHLLLRVAAEAVAGEGRFAPYRSEELGAMLVAALVLLAVSLFVLRVSRPGSPAALVASVVLAPSWVGLGFAHVTALRLSAPPADAVALTIAVVVGVWAGDVAAYLVGVATGRHRLAPSISPGKSWEGFAAGTAATVAVWLAAAWRLGMPIAPFLVLGLLVSGAGLLGDLAESKVKRRAGVKDSGSSIPGHGGFLDRFDSLVAVSPVAFWVLAGVLR